MRPIFTLGERLYKCAQLVRPGAKIVDVGTDHAYLPIWLAKKNLISHAIAADVREAPLEIAKKNIAKYRVDGLVETRLSDGLRGVSPSEAEDIIFAGMGGDLIARLIGETPWLKDREKRLILQPMSAEADLRRFLAKAGYKIAEEEIICDERRVYTVMCASFAKENIELSALEPYIGAIKDPLSPAAQRYLRKEIVHIQNQARGLLSIGNKEAAGALQEIVRMLESIINK